MTLYLVIVVAVVVVAGGVVRWRLTHRARIGGPSRPLERRLIQPPPSPYEPSRGFRLVDSASPPLERPSIARPRIDPHRSYVFSESSSLDDVSANATRRSDDWLLTRSSRRSPLSSLFRRFVAFVIALAVVAVLVFYYVDRRSPARHPTPPSSTIRSGAPLTRSAPATL